jgi:hypothetical protein
VGRMFLKGFLLCRHLFVRPSCHLGRSEEKLVAGRV